MNEYGCVPITFYLQRALSFPTAVLVQALPNIRNPSTTTSQVLSQPLPNTYPQRHSTQHLLTSVTSLHCSFYLFRWSQNQLPAASDNDKAFQIFEDSCHVPSKTSYGGFKNRFSKSLICLPSRCGTQLPFCVWAGLSDTFLMKEIRKQCVIQRLGDKKHCGSLLGFKLPNPPSPHYAWEKLGATVNSSTERPSMTRN